jgi:hypothetical protein
MGPPPMRLGFRSRIAPSTRVIASLVVHQIPDRHVRTDLELFDEHRFGNGVVHLRYRVST